MHVLYIFTSFLAAMLLFAIEPFAAREILPIFGGSPAVWNASVMFFQIELLAGYLYAHVLTTYLSQKMQYLVHAVVLALALAVPVGIAGHEVVPHGVDAGNAAQVWALVRMLLKSVGLPFFAVASAGPILGSWFGKAGHRHSHDPYFLYAASNVGSIVGLIAYPFVIEPFLSLTTQARWWHVGLAAFFAAIVILIVLTIHSQRAGSKQGSPARLNAINTNTVSHGTLLSEQVSFGRWVKWVLLAAIPSSLMLGVTQYLSTDIAPVPLLWVVPLAIYLLSFVAAFSRVGDAAGRIAIRLWPFVAIALLAVFLLHARQPIFLLVLLHLTVLAVAGCLCHARLRADRPPVRSLTTFYLALAIGGALGGVFNTLLAPVVFNDLYEYPLLIALACLALPRTSASGSMPAPQPLHRLWLTGSIVALGVWVWFGPSLLPMLEGHGASQQHATVLERMLFVGLPVFAVYLTSKRPAFFTLAMVVVLATTYGAADGSRVKYQKRTFFGVHRVMVDPSGRFIELLHGSTVHGVASLDPSRRDIPLAYYDRKGPAGFVFGLQDRGIIPVFRRAAFVGLGAGSMAAYGKEGQHFDFYEIDPVVVDIATNPAYFSFVNDSLADINFIIGDGRLNLARPMHAALKTGDSSSHALYDIIVLDAFSSDAVPIHLLTKEAIAIYRSRLSPDGILLFHLSNLHLDLVPFVAAACLDAQKPPDGQTDLSNATPMIVRVRRDLQTMQSQQKTGRFASTWLIATHNQAIRDAFDHDVRWEKPVVSKRAWTDAHADIVAAMIAKYRQISYSTKDRAE